jgi:putative hydrolase of the HAD superfamily
MSVRAVLLDLDGTLLRDDHMTSVVDRVAAELGRRYGVDGAALAAADAREWASYWPGVETACMLGSVPTDGIVREVWRRALDAMGVADPGAPGEALSLHAALEGAAWRLYPETLDVLDALRDRGIRLAIITNGPSALQRAKLVATGVSERVDAVVVSGELGAQKPDPALFATALEQLGVAATDALHVGDSREADVAGARAAGVRSVWLDRAGRGDPGGIRPDHVVGDLTEVLALVG